MASKPPKHKHGVVATERGWCCKKTGELLKRSKGLLDSKAPAAKPEPAPEPEAPATEEAEAEECEEGAEEAASEDESDSE